MNLNEVDDFVYENNKVEFISMKFKKYIQRPHKSVALNFRCSNITFVDFKQIFPQFEERHLFFLDFHFFHATSLSLYSVKTSENLD